MDGDSNSNDRLSAPLLPTVGGGRYDGIGPTTPRPVSSRLPGPIADASLATPTGAADDGVDGVDALRTPTGGPTAQPSATAPRQWTPRSLSDAVEDGTSSTSDAAAPAASSSADEKSPPRPPPPTEAAAAEPAALTASALAVILFFNAGGGPFGVEPSLKAAGNLYALVGFAAMPLLWALPEVIMTYQLSSLYPCASGGVRWTEEAFGESCGLFVGYLGWVAGVTDSATAPVLFLSYVHAHYFPDISETDVPWIHFGIMAGIAVALACVNYRGLDVVGKASALVFLVSMAPFLVMVAIGILQVDPDNWLQTPTDEVEAFDDDALARQGWVPQDGVLAGIAFRPLVNNLYWNYKGFDQGGHYSAVVPRRTLRNGMGAAFLTVSATYLLPILVATGATDVRQDQWRDGSLATAAADVGGRWLGNWVVVAAGVSLLAQFISGMSADSLQLQGMADRGQLPPLFSHRSSYDTPTYGLLLSLSVILVLLPLPFGAILELTNFAFCMSVIIEFLAFGQLMIRKGDCTLLLKAAYTIMLVAPMLLNVAVLLLASYATYIYGAFVTSFGLLLIIAKKCWDRAR